MTFTALHMTAKGRFAKRLWEHSANVRPHYPVPSGQMTQSSDRYHGDGYGDSRHFLGSRPLRVIVNKSSVEPALAQRPRVYSSVMGSVLSSWGSLAGK
jgi:hypothetical protein